MNNIPQLVQIMVYYRPGDKPLSEPMIVRLPTNTCVTWLQWVKCELVSGNIWVWINGKDHNSKMFHHITIYDLRLRWFDKNENDHLLEFKLLLYLILYLHVSHMIFNHAPRSTFNELLNIKHYALLNTRRLPNPTPSWYFASISVALFFDNLAFIYKVTFTYYQERSTIIALENVCCYMINDSFCICCSDLFGLNLANHIYPGYVNLNMRIGG